MKDIGPKGTPAFAFKPTHWSFGPFLLWFSGIGTLLIIRILVRNTQAYQNTIGFVVPMLNMAYILGACLVTYISGGRLKDLGITRRYSVLALALGLLVGFCIIGMRTLDPRFSGYISLDTGFLPLLSSVIGIAFHCFAEEVLFRGYFVGRLSRDFGWIPAIIISALCYGLAPFALIGADPTAIYQVQEISRFFSSVFPAVFLLGLFLALVYRFIGNLITPWFGVTLSVWTYGYMKGGMNISTNYPIFKLIGLIVLIIFGVLIIRRIQKFYGEKPVSIKEIKNMID